MKTADNKIRVSSVFNDSATNAFRVTWSERVRHRNALIEMSWEDAIQGVGMAMSTVVSEKNREMLFIGKVFYKQ